MSATGRRPRAELLTDRQYQVLQLLRRGQTNKEIGRDLRMTEGTVKVHVRSILRNLGVVNRVQAAMATVDLIEDEPENPKTREMEDAT